MEKPKQGPQREQMLKAENRSRKRKCQAQVAMAKSGPGKPSDIVRLLLLGQNAPKQHQDGWGKNYVQD